MDHDKPRYFFEERDSDVVASSHRTTKCVVYEIDDEEESKDAATQIGKEPLLIDEDFDDLKYSKMAKEIADYEVKPYDHREPSGKAQTLLEDFGFKKMAASTDSKDLKKRIDKAVETCDE
jgi:hypothetical protein